MNTFIIIVIVVEGLNTHSALYRGGLAFASQGRDRYYSTDLLVEPQKAVPQDSGVTKQSDYEVPIILELWGMRSTPSLPSLQGSLWPRVVAPDRVLSMGQIELFDI